MINRLLSKSLATSAVIVAASTSLVALSASESKAVVVGFNDAVGAVNGAYSSGTFSPALGTTDDNFALSSTTLNLIGFTSGGNGNTVTSEFLFNVTGLITPGTDDTVSFDYNISNPDGIPLLAEFAVDGTFTTLAPPNGPFSLSGISPTTTNIGFRLSTNVVGTANAPILSITNFSAPGTPVPTTPPDPTTTPEPSAVLGLMFLLGAGSLKKARKA